MSVIDLDETTPCKNCGDVITEIMDGAEWRYIHLWAIQMGRPDFGTFCLVASRISFTGYPANPNDEFRAEP